MIRASLLCGSASACPNSSMPPTARTSFAIASRMRTLLLLICLVSAACSRPDPQPQANNAPTVNDTLAQDSIIALERMAEAKRERWDTLPVGPLAARIGRNFVGAPYTPGTLEQVPERLVVNLRTFDCVTFVESSLALARAVKYHAQPTFATFRQELQRIRYRAGIMDEYPSRLHYFSEWIHDNEQKGIVSNITVDLGGVRDARPIHFMTTNRDAYKQLSSDAFFEKAKQNEAELSGRTRYMIPESQIAEAAAKIQDGDVIAAVSTLPGLDIAHTGLALWQNGKLHLMHAPLVGSHVEISEVPLADRILKQEKQNGVMVARPQ